MNFSMGNHSVKSDYLLFGADLENVTVGVAIFRPPLFERERVPEWFADMEQHFETFHVTTDSAKCDMLIDQLDWEMLDVIGTDSTCSAAAEGQRYQALKTSVLKYCGNDGQEVQEGQGWQQLPLQSN